MYYGWYFLMQYWMFVLMEQFLCVSHFHHHYLQRMICYNQLYLYLLSLSLSLSLFSLSLSLSLSRIGTVTAIPLSIMVDYIIKRTTSSVFVYIGMVLIGIGFIGFCTSEFLHIRQESATQDTLSTDEVVI